MDRIVLPLIRNSFAQQHFCFEGLKSDFISHRDKLISVMEAALKDEAMQT